MEAQQPKVTVKQDELNPGPLEIIASSILDISNSMKVLSRTRLNRRALVTLIHDISKVPRRDIDLVLTSLQQLESLHLRPVKK